jgi:hypothetical protein
MSGRPSYKRFPAIQCWLKHLEECSYDENENLFYTIFGVVKRIRIIATIIDKKENLVEFGEDNISLMDDSSSNVNLIFILDDSTGLIGGKINNIDPKKYEDFYKGQIVDVVGLISKKSGPLSLSIEIIKKVEDPNYILLRNAEIINRIKSGDTQEIPDIPNVRKGSEELSKEIDVNDLYEEDSNDVEGDNIKERLFSIIEKHTARGHGISFESLKKEINIPDIELRTYINDLILESRIYESDSGIYESF